MKQRFSEEQIIGILSRRNVGSACELALLRLRPVLL
jgi:hypothetical protein